MDSLISEQLQPLILAADGEGGAGQFLFWIAVVIILGIQHVVEKHKEKREAKYQEQFGKQAKEDGEDWEDWMEVEEAETAPQPSAGDQLASFFRNVVESAAPPVVETPPPVVAEPASPPPPPARSTRPGPSLSRAEQLALEAIKKRRAEEDADNFRSYRDRMHSSKEHNALGRMLRNPTSLRNAFILKEILEPPMAAREDPDPHRN